MFSRLNKSASMRSPLRLISNHIARSSVSARQTTSVVSPLATLSSSGIRVSWPEGGESHFHNIWLRDHCRCPRCLHQVTRQRLFDTFSIPDTIKPSNIDWDDQGLRIRWGESDHESNFRWPWLRSNSFTSQTPSQSIPIPSNKILWGKEIAQNPPTVSYQSVMQDGEEGIRKWLDYIDSHGFCYVTGVPVSPEKTEELAKMISHIRMTHWGGFWDFTADESRGDTAYSNLALRAHTDNTYYTEPSGLQMFHMLEFRGKGGESLLVDGFQAAKILKEKYPESYEILSTVRIPTHAAGDDGFLFQPTPNPGYPILNHGEGGELYQIRYNNDDRSTMRHLPYEQVEPFYTALKRWSAILTDVGSEYWRQLTPGTLVVFDNWRVLHGRAAFTGYRRLCGCYISWDDYQSRLKVARLKTNNKQVKDVI
ncbi:hypothetical protein PROFUN_15318 [Planoprotostelium fungivorum]|uniref:trimethyllysine dioxygenase n=1 Tax=Planoprotostelium fungivorum TaxID=1890364 RepID=A0A2P6MX23_9EUKA|nr:hypothetical protein PROFUN_15318 [Planoprotostelium fungivorum]